MSRDQWAEPRGQAWLEDPILRAPALTAVQLGKQPVTPSGGRESLELCLVGDFALSYCVCVCV